MGLINRRIGLLFALFLLLLGLASMRAAWLGTVRADSLKERAVTQQVEDLDVPARRGTITDRRGVELAVSEDAVTVFANPFLIKDPAGTAEKLAPLVGRTSQQLLPLLSDRKEGFTYLRRKMDPGLGQKVDDLEIEGIGTIVEPKRTYPQGAMASQLLGAVGTDNVGLAGLEQQHEKTLHGKDGRRRLVKDAMGEPISIVEIERAEAGQDMRLTLDAALQERVEAVMGEVGQAHRPRAATALVMDPRNGEVLALSNWPRVDANDIGSAPQYARQNRAVGASYEPGSTFKAFTVAGALEERLINPTTKLDLPPQIQVADRTIGEAHDRGSLTLTVAEVLAQSSNVGSVMIGLKLGKERFDKWVRRFGFGKLTGIGLPGEAGGIVPKPRQYSGSSLGNLPIGQGLAVTPLQMAAGYSAIANGGVMHRPHVIAGETDGGGGWCRATPPERSRGCSRACSPRAGPRRRRRCRATSWPVRPAPRRSPIPKTGGYSEFKFFSSFIGFAPARNPRLMVAVMVDEPAGLYYGGEVAAPAFERIIEFALPYLRIPPR